MTLVLLLFLDIVHLKGGGKIEGKVLDRSGGRVKIQTAHGVVEVEASRVVRIEEKPWEPPGRKERAGPELGNTFREPWVNFRITLPKGWRPVEASGPVTFRFEGPRDGPYRPALDLYLEANGQPLIEFVRRHEEQVKKGYREASFRVVEAVEAGRRRAMIAVAETGGRFLKVRSLWGFVDGGDRKMTLVWSAPAGIADRFEELVRASMKSVRLFDPNPAKAAERAEFRRRLTEAGRLAAAGDPLAAARELRRAAEIAPNFPEVHCRLGQMLAASGKAAAAKAALERAVEIDPDHWPYLLELARILARLHEEGRAERMAEKAVRRAPRSADAHLCLGKIRLGRGDLEGAEEALVRALELDPESADGHYSLGRVYEAQGKRRMALREYEDAVKLDPSHEKAREALRRLAD